VKERIVKERGGKLREIKERGAKGRNTNERGEIGSNMNERGAKGRNINERRAKGSKFKNSFITSTESLTEEDDDVLLHVDKEQMLQFDLPHEDNPDQLPQARLNALYKKDSTPVDTSCPATSQIKISYEHDSDNW